MVCFCLFVYQALILRAPYPEKVADRASRDSGELGLSAAVSVCCTVRKSSVMAYLMVIVWSGESPASRLHAGISGVCSGGDSSYSRGEQKGGGGLLRELSHVSFQTSYKNMFVFIHLHVSKYAKGHLGTV